VIRGVAPSLWAARITKKRQRIGRSEESEVRVVHTTVSRLHAEVWRDDRDCYIKDLDSRNGTFIDGKQTNEASFNVGATIQVGQVALIAVPSIDHDDGDVDETELLSKSPDAWQGLLEKLSPGQLQVVTLLLRGFGEKEVAEQLCLSRHTVHTHIKSIYKLLDVQSRAQLLAKYLGKGTGNRE
jgi:DNA-binding CsgD family transcriptional regulator